MEIFQMGSDPPPYFSEFWNRWGTFHISYGGHMRVIWESYGGHMGVIWGSYEDHIESYGGLMVSYGDQIRGIWGLYGSHVGFAAAARYLHLHLVIIFVLTSIFRPPSSTTTTTTTTSISTSSSVSAYTLHRRSCRVPLPPCPQTPGRRAGAAKALQRPANGKDRPLLK